MSVAVEGLDAEAAEVSPALGGRLSRIRWPRGPERDAWIPRVGQPGRHKWMFAAIWLIYLVEPLGEVVHDDRSLGWKALNFAMTLTFVALYGSLAFFSFPRSGRIGTAIRERRASLPLVLFLAGIAAVSCLAVNSHLIGMWIYVGAGSGLSLPFEHRLAQRFVMLAVVGVSLCSKATHLGVAEWLSLLFPTFFSGVATIGIRQMASLIGELREAREQVARLAANEERLRLARDLHDLTGHSLSMITLKAQLAQRLVGKAAEAAATASPDLPRDQRLAAALTEVAEIEQVSRQTLTDIREAVSGYRRATLAVELASACTALDAAGMKLDADPAIVASSGTYDPELENVLAWCLREAVTNAIRHSGATRVRVRLAETGGELALTVWNDGRGLAADGGGAGVGAGGTAGAAGGNGLAGLRERLDSVGGRLALGGSDGDFRLVATAPVPSGERAGDGSEDGR